MQRAGSRQGLMQASKTMQGAGLSGLSRRGQTTARQEGREQSPREGLTAWQEVCLAAATVRSWSGSLAHSQLSRRIIFLGGGCWHG